MKTKLYIEPGTELDWDNENHRRHIEAEAFASVDKHPKPTVKAPPRSRFWWFWRMFGYLVFMPARRAWGYYTHAHYLRLKDDELGPWTLRYQSSEAIKTWISYGCHRGSISAWIRGFFYWLFIQSYSICPHCGFTEFEDEYRMRSRKDPDGHLIEMFELVEGGGTDYWGEAEDCHGWMWCYRCGSVSWETI